MIKKIGIIGGGQLGRMLAQSAIELGYKVTVIDPSENCPAAQAGAEQIQAELTDTDAIDQLVARSDVVTWEIEHIPTDHLIELADKGVNIEPSPQTLATIQDKLTQKQLLQSKDIPVAPFSAELDERQFTGGGPFVVKSRRGGYDGRGNLVVDSLTDKAIQSHFGDQPAYIEQVVEFERELAVIAARDKQGNIRTYPVVETIHKDNICQLVMSPAEVGEEIAAEAVRIAEATLRELEGAGVFAIEMFVVDGKVLVNEIAPRVHNSGHHTIEANVTSQFEQHIRAITGLPLGDTSMRIPSAAMVNILGARDEQLNREGLDKVLALPDTHPHFYGKDPRPSRKVGHITALGESLSSAKATALKAREELSI